MVVRRQVEEGEASWPQHVEEDSEQAGIESFNQAGPRCSGAQLAAGIDRAINKVGLH